MLSRIPARTARRRRGVFSSFLFACGRYRALLLMLLPGVAVFVVNCYLPMAGVFLAFKKIDYAAGLLRSPWVGLENFRFLFATTDAWRITRNTICYNLLFIFCDVFSPWAWPCSCGRSGSRCGPRSTRRSSFCRISCPWWS